MFGLTIIEVWFLFILLWLTVCFLSFGVTGIYFLFMRRTAKRPWKILVDRQYAPRISIIIPTKNESQIIRQKLLNIDRIEYPKDKIQLIVVDSKSNDNTLTIVERFAEQHPYLNLLTLSLDQEGKSKALNFALRNSIGDVIIISDADCFWSQKIMQEALPYLSDPSVGAVSGPKILMNPNSTWVTKTENAYLVSMNTTKLGESKLGFTTLFEGGFSAYKRAMLPSFDPYGTGSDDCGSLIKLAENGHKAVFLPEAAFFTAFPTSWKGKMQIKIRRANQLVLVFSTYLNLLLRGKVRVPKGTLILNTFIYLVSPLAFALFVPLTMLILVSHPYLMVLVLLFIIPRIGPLLFEVIQSYSVLLVGLSSAFLGKKFITWSQPADRIILTESLLRQNNLI